MVVGWWCHVTCPVIAPSLAPLAIQSTTTMASLLLLWITSGWCQTWESQTYTILLRSSCFCSRTHKVEHSCLCFPPIRLLFITQTDKIKSYGKAFSFFAIRLFKEFVLLLLLLPSPQFRVCVSTRKKKTAGAVLDCKIIIPTPSLSWEEEQLFFFLALRTRRTKCLKKGKENKTFPSLWSNTHTHTYRQTKLHKQRERETILKVPSMFTTPPTVSVVVLLRSSWFLSSQVD